MFLFLTSPGIIKHHTCPDFLHQETTFKRPFLSVFPGAEPVSFLTGSRPPRLREATALPAVFYCLNSSEVTRFLKTGDSSEPSVSSLRMQNARGPPEGSGGSRFTHSLGRSHSCVIGEVIQPPKPQCFIYKVGYSYITAAAFFTIKWVNAIEHLEQ